MSLLEKMRGDKKGWYKVSDLVAGLEIAVPSQNRHGDGQMIWDEIISIKPVGREQVYDIEVEGTHNFVGNGIFAHNTYVLRANTKLVVEGEVNAGNFIVPAASTVNFTVGTTTLTAEIPSFVLTADGKGIDLYKLSTYNLVAIHALAARMNEDEVRVTSLESRVEKLETGAISSASGSPLTIGTSSLASALASVGAYIQKGIAQFGSLVADRFVAATNSAGTSSAGTVTIITGNTVAQVTNAYVLPTSKIFVTFKSQITGSWWVSDKTADSFRVVLSDAQTTDVSFDYFLVQTEGQIATSTPSIPTSSGVGTPTSDVGATSSTAAPVITLLGDNPLHLSVGGTFTEPGIVVASGASYITYVNGIEGPATSDSITTGSEKTYIITYKAADSTATVTRAVIVGSTSVTTSGDSGSGGSSSGGSQASGDTIVPVVTLVGAAAMNLTVGDTFTDPGATATDDTDGDLTANIVVDGTVNTAVEGSYTLTYSATDAAGNIGSASRLVTVAAASQAPAPEPEPAP
ncbi:MAG: DUF5011 domain-containing protein [bacterium]|nr:DUF5011 domain-containing protein [bacterium]